MHCILIGSIINYYWVIHGVISEGIFALQFKNLGKQHSKHVLFQSELCYILQYSDFSIINTVNGDVKFFFFKFEPLF